MKYLKFFPYYKRNLKLAFPIILAQLGQVTVSLADTLMVGRLGTLELAAVSFANTIFIVAFLFGLGFSLGLTPLIGNFYGMKQPGKMSLLFQNSFLINTLLAFLLAVLIFLLEPFMYSLNQPQDVVKMALPYFNILLLTLIPSLIFFTCRQFGEGIGNTKVAMWITLAGNLINIAFNYILIYGKLGLPAMEVFGAGLATLIARIFMMAIFLIVIFKHPLYRVYLQYFSWKNFQKRYILQLTKTGLPISGQMVVEVLAFSLSAIMIGWINKVNIAAHQIVLQLASATFMVSLGVSSATTIRVAHQFGSRHYKAAKFAALAALHVVTAFMGLTALIFIIFRYQLPCLFSTDREVIELAAQLLVVAGIFQIFDGMQVVSLSALRGLTDVTFAMWAAIISYLFLCLPMGYVFSFIFNMGAVGVWMGLAAGLAVAGVVYRLRFINFMKRYI